MNGCRAYTYPYIYPLSIHLLLSIIYLSPTMSLLPLYLGSVLIKRLRIMQYQTELEKMCAMSSPARLPLSVSPPSPSVAGIYLSVYLALYFFRFICFSHSSFSSGHFTHLFRRSRESVVERGR